MFGIPQPEFGTESRVVERPDQKPCEKCGSHRFKEEGRVLKVDVHFLGTVIKAGEYSPHAPIFIECADCGNFIYAN